MTLHEKFKTMFVDKKNGKYYPFIVLRFAIPSNCSINGKDGKKHVLKQFINDDTPEIKI